MIKLFDRTILKTLQADLEKALAPVAAKHGITLSTASLRGTTDQIRINVVASVNGKNGEKPEELRFKKYAHIYGLKPEDLGRQFTAVKTTYTIAGLRDGRAKNNILINRVPDKKQFVMASEEVARYLNHKANGDTVTDKTQQGKITGDNTDENHIVARINQLADEMQDISAHYHTDFETKFAREREILDELDAISASQGDGLKVGKLISFSVADGRALYAIVKVGPRCKVRHIAFGDAWTHPLVRNNYIGRGAAEDAVRGADGLRKLFGDRKVVAMKPAANG